MAFVHGMNTVITVAAKDISAYCKTSSFELSADVHETTGYGKTAKTRQGGLLDGKFTCGGTYDSTASTGPRAALKPLLGTSVAVVRKPEGTGTGKPSDAFSGVLTKYVETSPVDDMVTWSAEFEISDVVTTTTQP
ncbi:hypothetical protein [Micromonospora globispora]|uniref:hypothetical protein n=1 Tax=Micromonospora globispora TaxID=1450148 RepID=UPI000F5E557A|nr:hypothetical protein [Micromonospora globispora]RQW83556.1 hypothetical protein DKL51_31515 [Micromonospora globispora]